jgi:hypothetical protein
MVDVWSYLDARLQSQRLAELKENPSGAEYLHVLSVREKKLIRLQHENEDVAVLKGKKEEIVFIRRYQADSDPYEPWNRFAQSSNHLVFDKSGRSVDIEFELANSNPKILSPNGNYLLLMDKKEKDLYS